MKVKKRRGWNAHTGYCFYLPKPGELAHFEMVGTIVHQLTRDLSMEEIEKSGFAPYYVDHTLALWPQAAGGIPFNSCQFQSKGDVITDLTEDMAADGARRKQAEIPMPQKMKQRLKQRRRKPGKCLTSKWYP